MKFNYFDIIDNGWKLCVPGGKGLPENDQEVLAIFPVHNNIQNGEETEIVLEKVVYKNPIDGNSYWWSNLYSINIHPICWQHLPKFPEDLQKV